MYGLQANRAGDLRYRKIKFTIFAASGYVVQLDRISDFDSEGWRFESFRGHFLEVLFNQMKSTSYFLNSFTNTFKSPNALWFWA